MYSPLLRDAPPASNAQDLIALPGTAYRIARAHLRDEARLLRALHDLEQNAEPIALDARFIDKRRHGFINNKKVKLEPDQLDEQAHILFDELTQPTPLCIITGPPGAAKTVVASLWANLVHESLPQIPFVLITRERPALRRLQDKINVPDVITLTVDDAMQDSVRFPERACIIVDEAGLCCTKQMGTLLEKSAATHARRVILIGDDKQLFPDNVGQPFRWLRENNKAQVVTLTNSFRQKTATLRQMVQALHAGDLQTAIEMMDISFMPSDAVIKTVRERVTDRAPEKTLVIVHGSDFLIERLRVLCPGFRIYSLGASQGLAIDEITLVIAAKLNLSELLVGCSRQRFALDVVIDETVYADRAALIAGVGDYPKTLMAMDVIDEKTLLDLAA